MPVDLRRNRERMVRDQIQGRGIDDPAVLEAMSRVKRHLFVEEALQAQAYGDHPLPIGHGQTISQPFIVALMSSLINLEPGMKVLEIGTGSGYQAAVLAEMGGDVYTVERIRELYLAARKRLSSLRYFRIHMKLDDGTMGWPEEAPFDRILVTAGAPEIPEPLVGQLADGGRMIIPVGKKKRSQGLYVLTKHEGKIEKEFKESVAFVDLVETHGW